MLQTEYHLFKRITYFRRDYNMKRFKKLYHQKNLLQKRNIIVKATGCSLQRSESKTNRDYKQHHKKTHINYPSCQVISSRATSDNCEKNHLVKTFVASMSILERPLVSKTKRKNLPRTSIIPSWLNTFKVLNFAFRNTITRRKERLSHN